MEFLYFLIIVAVLGGVFFFFNKGKSNVVGGGETGIKPTPVKTAPAPAPAPVVKEETKKVPSKAVLGKMTKKELDAFATDFGVTLDARKTKDAMITDFQKEAKKL